MISRRSLVNGHDLKFKMILMAAIKRFEDIKAWQKARDLTNEIYEISYNGIFTKDFALQSQIRKATTSIMLNIAEGFGRKSDREFRQFLIYANGSSLEVQSALYIALDQNYISQKEFEHLYSLTQEISKMIQNFSKYLSKNK
jgi:four helix bundle protein